MALLSRFIKMLPNTGNYKTAIINNRLNCTAYELTVSGVLSLLFATNDLTLPENNTEYSAILAYRVFNDESFLKLSIPFKKLTDDEKNAAFEFWTKTNDAFLNPYVSNYEREKRKTSPQKPIKIKQQYDDLAQSIAVLVRWKHTNILNYPWSLFVAVNKAIKEESEAMKKNG
jgi:uncharacterized protein YozE (UPF0346 family)